MALVSNGSSQYSTHTLTTLLASVNSFTIAFTFKTGATVTGVTQVPLHINRASSWARGWGIEINTTGQIRGFLETGSRSWTSSLGTATPNTVYTVVIKKANDGAGTGTFYLNSLGNSQVRPTTLSVDLTRIISGAMYSNAYGEYFGGKVGRIAFWPSLLSNADITICLDNAQTPAACSVTPQDYWIAISNDTATNGSNATVRTGTTYDSDALSAAEITTITNPMAVGGAFSFTGAGWTGGTFTSITTNITGAATASSISGTTSSGSAVLSDWAEGVIYSEVPYSATLTFTDGTATATKTSTVNPKDGYVKVTIATPPELTYNSLGTAITAQTGRPVIVGDVFYYDPYDDLVITSDTDYTVSSEGTFDLWLRVAAGADAGNMYNYTVTITESGAVVVTGGGLTSSGLTSSGLTSSGLTSSGL